MSLLVAQKPPLLQPSGHWPGIGLVGIAIHPGVKVLDRIGEQIKPTRFKPKSEWARPLRGGLAASKKPTLASGSC